jgi:3-oxoacyl-[acyl-carrier protein] reductase
MTELSREEWDRVLDVNLNGTFNWTHAVVPGMVDRAYGRIVSISSLSGGHIGWSGKLSAYAASKGGVVGFTRSAAIDLAPKGVTMNAIAPGMIDTGAPQAANTEEELEAAVAMTPVGRMGEPEEIAATVVFLASEEAAYITGATVVVDGGYSLL